MDEITISVSEETMDILIAVSAQLGITVQELVDRAFTEGLGQLYSSQ